MFKPSKFQEKIFDFIVNDTKNAVISAVAGSGKTTTLLKALELIPKDKRVLFLAFNKSIANELKIKVGEKPNVRIVTVHALGYQSILKNRNTPTIDAGKYEKLYNEIYFLNIRKKSSNFIIENGFKKETIKLINTFFNSIKNQSEINWGNLKSSVIKLCDLGRMYNIDIENKKNSLNQLKNIAEIYTIPIDNDEHILAFNLIKIGSTITTTIDFTDMIYLPLKNNYDLEKFDMVFIDECQDLNTCQREMMIKSMNPINGRFIAIGDKKQTIYSFAGSDYASYDKLCEIDNTIRLPLSYTYRCGKKIVDFVKQYNEDIIAFENNPTGEILETFSFRNLRSGDMVLCRHSFPAVSLCVKLLSINKSAHVIGIDTGNFIIKTINDTKKDGVEFTMVNVIAQLKHNLTKIIEKFVTTHLVTEREAMDEPFIFMLDETIKIIESLTKEKDTPEMVIDRVKKIFKETKSEGICLSTIHKSKGLEADRVFILHPELMPSNKAKTKIEIEQENNLIYVAYTRAINTLGFIYDYNAYNSHATLKDSDKIIIGSSSHVGNIGEKKMLTLEIIKIKEVDTKFGKTKIFEMIDKDSNKFSKFGEIDREFLIGNNNKIDVGSKVYFCGQIRAHTEFNGEKITQIGRIS